MRLRLALPVFALLALTRCSCGNEPDDPGIDSPGGGGSDAGVDAGSDAGADAGGDGGGGTNPNCLGDGTSCTAGGQCCSLVCSSTGQCVASTGAQTCNGIGQACASGFECCTGVCQPDSSGQYQCAPGNVCKQLGGACQVAGDCCSKNCVGGTCQAGQCLVTGAACSAGDPGACCTGVCNNGQCAQPQNSACKVSGDRCSASGQNSSCCSEYCVDVDPSAGGTDLRCAGGSTCRSKGEPCRGPADCCSYSCGANGVCADPPANIGEGCRVAGSACVAQSDCCSGLCADDGSGFKVCQFIGGCRPESEICRKDTECCGVNASNATPPVCELYPTDAGVGRCSAFTGANAPAGEICNTSTGDQCAPNNDVCKESISGVFRCQGVCDGGTACGAGNCRGAGSACSTPDQCCNNRCVPTELGFVCSDACVAIGAACSAGADCCSGRCSLTGVCESIAPPLPDGGVNDAGVPPDAGSCLPISSPCSTSGQCCSGACDQGRCQAILG